MESGGTEKCTCCQEGIPAPGLRLSRGKEAALGTVLTAWGLEGGPQSVNKWA